jgi:hypothetical protein
MKLSSTFKSLVLLYVGLTLSFSGCVLPEDLTPGGDTTVQVAAPVFNPLGQTFSSTINVTISDYRNEHPGIILYLAY